MHFQRHGVTTLPEGGRRVQICIRNSLSCIRENRLTVIPFKFTSALRAWRRKIIAMNSPESPPVPARRSEYLRETIEERIATGEYGPGMRLDESELAEEFGVSRTPIREALIQLDSEGLVEMRPRRGAVVVEVSPQRLCEMFEVMAELEAMCARLAARRLTPADREQLVAVHEESQRVLDGGDPNAYFY